MEGVRQVLSKGAGSITVAMTSLVDCFRYLGIHEACGEVIWTEPATHTALCEIQLLSPRTKVPGLPTGGRSLLLFTAIQQQAD